MRRRGLVSSTQAAAILGGSVKSAREWMWAHGFDPIQFDDYPAFFWRKRDVEQVRDERIAWHLVVPQIEADMSEKEWRRQQRADNLSRPPGEMSSLAACFATTADREARDARTARREALAAQLESVPVHTGDVDYLASRAGERRKRGQTLGPTAFIKQRGG